MLQVSFSFKTQAMRLPLVFENPVVEQLYGTDIFIAYPILETILAQKGHVETDLMKIVTFVEEHFYETADEIDFYQDFYYIHALNLLYDLDYEPLVDSLLSTLGEADSEFQEFWLADDPYAFFIDFLSVLGRNQLDKLRAFVANADYRLHDKSIVMASLCRMARLYPEQRKEVIGFLQSCFDQLLRTHSNKEAEKLFPDDEIRHPGLYGYDVYEYVSFLMIYVGEYNLYELKPTVKQCYDRNLHNPFSAGEWKDFRMKEEASDLRRKTIFERYGEDKKNKHYAQYFLHNPEYETLKQKREEDERKREINRRKWEEEQQRNALKQLAKQPSAFAPKVGRNDSCPCGSGKKYKKCCGA